MGRSKSIPVRRHLHIPGGIITSTSTIATSIIIDDADAAAAATVLDIDEAEKQEEQETTVTRSLQQQQQQQDLHWKMSPAASANCKRQVHTTNLTKKKKLKQQQPSRPRRTTRRTKSSPDIAVTTDTDPNPTSSSPPALLVSKQNGLDHEPHPHSSSGPRWLLRSIALPSLSPLDLPLLMSQDRSSRLLSRKSLAAVWKQYAAVLLCSRDKNGGRRYPHCDCIFSRQCRRRPPQQQQQPPQHNGDDDRDSQEATEDKEKDKDLAAELMDQALLHAWESGWLEIELLCCDTAQPATSRLPPLPVSTSKPVLEPLLPSSQSTALHNGPVWHLQFYLTHRAMVVCQPTSRSSPKKKKKKKKKTDPFAGTLQTLFHILVESSKVPNGAVVSPHHPQQQHLHSNGSISAHQVYELIDNVQLERALNDSPKHDGGTSSTCTTIPGLVPTLRGYQQYALEWMLQRELPDRNGKKQEDSKSRSNIYNNNDEWELAWTILRPQRLRTLESNEKTSLEEMDELFEFQFLPHCKDPLVRSSQSHGQEYIDGSGRQNSASDFLLYCPFTGWLASSYHSAQHMTLGVLLEREIEDVRTDITTSSSFQVKGGILAESMGLGKTVEVIACILAHPRPTQQWCQPSRVSGVQRILFHAAEEDSSRTRTLNVESSCETELIASPVSFGEGVVHDISEFGDAEESSSSDEETIASQSDRGVHTSIPASRPVPITPERTSIQETFVDDAVLGSCICGQLIDLSLKTKSVEPIIICESCHEPMHKNCAAFSSATEMSSCTRIRYRQRFTDCFLDCWKCSQSLCPCCVAASSSKIASRATLIITPPAIIHQWEREISRHSICPNGKPLTTVVYPGLESSCKASAASKTVAMRLLHPRHLANADIVLAPFDALMGDLSHSDENRFVPSSSSSRHEMSTNYLRKRKRYRAVPSPLLSIDWWRVCLDEAQRVETPTAASSRMALKLTTEHRWCISGTPIGRGKLDDLFGLLLFLRVTPFSSKFWFTKSLNPSNVDVNERIRHLLRNLMWRSTKANAVVAQEIGVPEQVEKKIFLQASAMEKYFYQCQLEKTIVSVGDIAEREAKGMKRKTSHVNLLSEHLHRLRAACCHPQVGSSGIASSKRIRSSKGVRRTTAMASSKVMSMEQILVRFIDDAKLKCEEAQRLTILHINAMAAIWKLKVHAKERDVQIPESNEFLLENSCRLYLESLSLTEANANPTLVIENAVLCGSYDFSSVQTSFTRGVNSAVWKSSKGVISEPWVSIDFEGTPRKITQILIRSTTFMPPDPEAHWIRLRPKDCVFQVASAALGGSFVDVFTFTLPDVSASDGELKWEKGFGFHTNRSKTWRIVIKGFYNGASSLNATNNACTSLEFQLYEADIASDPLQRLHCLHNASLSFQSLFELKGNAAFHSSTLSMSLMDMKTKLTALNDEARKIEALYMEISHATHNECIRRLLESSSVRKDKQNDLFNLSRQAGVKKNRLVDVWDDGWWDDFLVHVLAHGTNAQKDYIREKLLHHLDCVTVTGHDTDFIEREKVKFPEFEDMNGFRTALLLRLQNIRDDGLGKDRTRTSRAAGLAASSSLVDSKGDLFVPVRSSRFHCPRGRHEQSMIAIAGLSLHPSAAEVFENSHCRECKADWFQTGPQCSHCKLHEEFRDLTPDQVTMEVLSTLNGVIRSQTGIALLEQIPNAFIKERAKLFFEVIEAEKREKVIGYRAWRLHLDLLNDLDELNQCKSSMRLTYEGEDLTQLANDQLNALVVPCDLNTRFHDHASKHVMAHGELRRCKDTLRYLQNLFYSSQSNDDDGTKGQEICSICLFPFDHKQLVAVLNCGHKIHLHPCLEQLKSHRHSNSLDIRCPMRCRQTTHADHVMIACSSNEFTVGAETCYIKTPTVGVEKNDLKCNVKGSWGTKITRLVADILHVRNSGEKGIVFSQWDDMLDIVELALIENGVGIVRAGTTKGIGAAVRRFRLETCTVLLLNVKNGAEGLTLLEATHVFMVEPILNCGLDCQAINRVHRIGQTKTTTVWRYLVEDTVEIKIDQLRLQHVDEQVEDEIHQSRLSTFKAGGIDGGFQTQQELLDLLR